MLKRIGKVMVDSGQLMITDPCYLKDWKDNEFRDGIIDDSYSYSGACFQTCETKDSAGQIGTYWDGEFAQGVAFASGYGDGCYEVFAEYDENKRIRKVIIEM